MKYPYIGEAPINDSPSQKSFDTCLFFSEGFGVVLVDNVNHGIGYISSEWCEQGVFKNITREYLEGKCVKIESPEHGEFVQKLAKSNGFKFCDTGNDENYIRFDRDGEWLYVSSSFDVKEITIPLPPKAEPKDDGWPQVGDTVTWGSQAENAEVIAIHKGRAWVFNESGHHVEVEAVKLKKPKTEAEILRDDLMEMAVTAMSNEDFDLEHNCYYLISGLMKKYNIKPQ